MLSLNGFVQYYRMSRTSEFVDFLLERMTESGYDPLTIQARAMFGGFGIYHEGIMFALVADDELYLKTGDNNAGDFEAASLPRFRYQRQGKEFEMSYSAAPVEIYDDAVMMKTWLDGAIDAARSADNRKRKKSGKP